MSENSEPHFSNDRNVFLTIDSHLNGWAYFLYLTKLSSWEIGLWSTAPACVVCILGAPMIAFPYHLNNINPGENDFVVYVKACLGVGGNYFQKRETINCIISLEEKLETLLPIIAKLDV